MNQGIFCAKTTKSDFQKSNKILPPGFQPDRAGLQRDVHLWSLVLLFIVKAELILVAPLPLLKFLGHQEAQQLNFAWKNLKDIKKKSNT